MLSSPCSNLLPHATAKLSADNLTTVFVENIDIIEQKLRAFHLQLSTNVDSYPPTPINAKTCSLDPSCSRNLKDFAP